MARSLFTITLSREDSSIPWGFRLDGGVDTEHPLNIKNVNPGSLADLAGLYAGDLVVCINRTDTRFMKHEEAKMEFIRSSNNFDILVERGCTTGIPSPINSISVTVESNNLLNNSPYISGISTNQRATTIGNTIGLASGKNHNIDQPILYQSTPMPGEAVIGKTADGRVQRLSAAKYNTPMGLYSKQNTENSFAGSVIAAGVSSGVLRQSEPTSVGGSLRCGACDNLIRGTMVRVSNRIPMHPECLKCAKCGIGLRKVGYFCINDSLYCELHAKQVAPPPEHGMKSVIVYK